MPRGIGALSVVHVHRRARSGFEGVLAYVADNTDHGQQPWIAVHISEFDGSADGILVGPLLPGEGFADQRAMRSLQGVALVKRSTFYERNTEGFEETVADDDKVGVTQARFVAEQFVENLSEFRKQHRILFDFAGDRSFDQILH